MSGTAVSIGAYDGVHLGHRALLRDLSARAEAAGLSTVVVTFDRHPAGVVRPESAPPQLTDLEQKLKLLAACGVERTYVVAFDRARADETAEDFVKEVLVDELDARLVVVGEDFHFGHGRTGNVALLTKLGLQYGFEVIGARLTGDDEPVSSTRIRTMVAQGDVVGAAAFLGRPHEVRGAVVRGDGRGGPELGFPTANLAVADDIGTALGGGAHIGLLRRTRIGSFGEGDMRLLDHLTPDAILTPAQAMRDLALVPVEPEIAGLIGRGLALDRVPVGAVGDGPWAMVDQHGSLLAVYEATGTDRIKPAVVVAGS